MSRIRNLFMAAALCMLADASPAQQATVSVRWALVPLDAPATAVSTHATQAACDAAARAINRTRVYRCDRQLDAVAAIGVPPTCTTPRPTDSQVLQCPTGQTGSWTQTRSVTAAIYPTCWEATAWTPAGAPAGACTPIVVTPPPTTGLPVVNSALIPAARAGSPTRDITTTTRQPERDGGGIGAFRTVCDWSHFKADDPLVLPGQVGASHLHLFFGNSLTDAFSTVSSIATTGNGSCRGGVVNRSGYWVPAMIDTATGAPVKPIDQSVSRSGFTSGIDVYYKTGYHGVRDADVKPIPPGFRMISGNSKSTAPQGGLMQYACDDGNYTAAMPRCAAGQWLYLSVQFPQCWNGVDLDSPDHKSHVARATDGRGCVDPKFPIALPEVTYVVKYAVPAGGMAGWRLSSDINGTPAGSSLHGDYFFGWEDGVMPTAVVNIINKGLSGGSDLIGDGRSIFMR